MKISASGNHIWSKFEGPKSRIWGHHDIIHLSFWDLQNMTPKKIWTAVCTCWLYEFGDHFFVVDGTSVLPLWLEDVMLALVVELMETLQAASRLEPTNPGIERNDSWMPGGRLTSQYTKNIRSGFNLLFFLVPVLKFHLIYIIYLYT